MKKCMKTAAILLCLCAAAILLRPVQALAGGIWAEIKVRYIILESDGRWSDCIAPAEDYMGVTAQLTCPDHSVMKDAIDPRSAGIYEENSSQMIAGEHRFFIANEDDLSKMMPGKYTLTDSDYPKGYEYDNAMEDKYPLYVELTQKDIDDYISFAATSEGGEGKVYEILVPVKKTGTISAVLQKPENVQLSASTDNTCLLLEGRAANYSAELQYATQKNGTYKTLETGENLSAYYFSDSPLKHGKAYYFRARFYKTVNGKKLYGDYNEPIKVKVLQSLLPAYQPILKVVKERGVGLNLNTEGPNQPFHEYKISYTEKKNGKYKEIKKTFYGSVYVSQLKDFGVKPGKTYYFRVRLFEKKKSGTFYSLYSKPKKIKV